MRKDVFDYLRIITFTDDEINYIEDKNDNIFYVNLIHAKKIITILRDLGLDIENIRKVLTKNVFLITEHTEKINEINKIYLEDLKLTNEELKNLIIKNPDTYIVSVSELNKNIDYLKEHNCNIETIRNFLITNPQLVSMSPEEFKNIVKFN